MVNLLVNIINITKSYIFFFLQIEFLNSVIIDLQNKNSEMTQRLAAMENGGLLNGGDSSFDIGYDLKFTELHCPRMIWYFHVTEPLSSGWVPMELHHIQLQDLIMQTDLLLTIE